MLGTRPYWKPSRADLKSSPASRGSWRISRKSGFRRLQARIDDTCFPTLLLLLLDAPLAVLDADDAHADALLGVGGDGELGELALLHPDVPVSVDLAAPEPFLPGEKNY